MFPEGLFPSINGLHLEALRIEIQSVTAVLTVATLNATCPVCGVPAMRVHSRYVRRAADLPWAGRRVCLEITIRRFFCDNVSCTRRIFAERLGVSLPVYARRTSRLIEALCTLAFAAGGEGGARLAHAQGLPASPRTLLRLLYAFPLPESAPARVVGIDEWAWKKGRSYGTILVDLERKYPIDLLSDRNADSVKTWFEQHPGVEIIVRDRSGLFADGAKRGAPEAMQVIDRYHLIKNLVEAVERFFLHKRTILKAVHKKQQAEWKHSNPTMRSLPVMQADPPSQQAEIASLRRHKRAIERYKKIQKYHAKNVDIATIAQHVGASRQTVYRYLQMNEPPMRKQPQSTRKKLIESYQPYLVKRWNEGVRNSQQLWRELREQGVTFQRRP